MYVWIVIAVLFVVWVLINLKTSRPDGTLIKNVHPYRLIMGYIMPTRTESMVYFDSYVDAEALLAFVAEKKEDFHLDITHCLVAAVGLGLAEAKTMNRFIVGRRLYNRNGRFITFSMKRKKADRKAKLATVKMHHRDGESFQEFVERIHDSIGEQRSDKRTYDDKEFDLFGFVPRPVLIKMVRLLFWLDHHNLLPGSFLENDKLYTSCFIANLGSLKMGAAFHHLYEWGNCPLFLMAGAIEDRPVVIDGQVAVRKTLHLRWTYDERIDDGLNARFGIDAVKNVLENPNEFLV